MGDNTSYYNNRMSTNNEYNENTKNNEKNINLDQNDIDDNITKDNINNLNESKEIKEESSNTFSSHKNEKKLKNINNNNIYNNSYNSNEKENMNINGSNNNNIINNKNNIRNQFLEKFENDSKQKNIYNLINTKRGNDTDPNIDGLEDFNDLIYDKKNLNVNEKYNTININQIQKTIPILLSDEAFNRKMKEYQTEIFRKKKELEINDIDKRINKNGTDTKMNINNININNSHSDDILTSSKKNGTNDIKKEKESKYIDENEKIKNLNNSSLFRKDENNINYKKDNNIEDENDNNIRDNEEEKIYIENKLDNNNLETDALKTIDYNLDKEKNKNQGKNENIKNDDIITEDIIIEQNLKETVPDLNKNKILEEISTEKKSKDENINFQPEKENKEKLADNQLIIKELEKIEEQDEEQNEDQKEEIKETIEITEKKEEDKKNVSSIDKTKEIIKEAKIKEKEEIIIEELNKEQKEQKPEEPDKTKDDISKNDTVTKIILKEEKKEEPKIDKDNSVSPKYEKKFGDINIMNDPEKENKLRARLNARMKLLQGKGKDKDSNNKFTPLKKSEFIGLQAMLLQQQMGHRPANNTMEPRANSSFSEKLETKEKRLSMNDIIINIPVTQKRKKSKKIFFDE